MPISAGVKPGAPDLMDGLVQVSFAVMAILQRTAAAHDLSLTQLRAMAILRDRTPTMAALADHLGLERSSVSGLIGRGIRSGLVRREPSPNDGRSILVSLTADGQRMATVVAEEIAGLLSPMLMNLSITDAQRLTALLGKLVTHPAD